MLRSIQGWIASRTLSGCSSSHRRHDGFIFRSSGTPYEAHMPARVSLIPAFIIALAVLAADPAAAAERKCLTKEQQRAAIQSGKAVRLAVAVRAVKRRGEVVRARLCEGGKGLVYMLTVLSRDGKVAHVTIDATSGSVLTGS
jgi:hypothetical protein